MLWIDCPFCHKKVLRFFYAGYRAKHTAPLPDGQMKDHITVHSTGRYKGSLSGIPQVYRHPKCGVATKMPDGDYPQLSREPVPVRGGSFCCGCNDYVPEGELFWTETGQNMAEYNQDLKEAYRQVHGEPPPKPTAWSPYLRPGAPDRHFEDRT
jgi:hypothetical protein